MRLKRKISIKVKNEKKRKAEKLYSTMEYTSFHLYYILRKII